MTNYELGEYGIAVVDKHLTIKTEKYWEDF